MVVDDSVVIRGMISRWIGAEPDMGRHLYSTFRKSGLTPRLSAVELARIAELKSDNFGVGPEQGRFKGTMSPPDDVALAAQA